MNVATHIILAVYIKYSTWAKIEILIVKEEKRMFQKIIIIKIHMETVLEADKSLDGDVMTMTAVVYDMNTSEQTIKQYRRKNWKQLFYLWVSCGLQFDEVWGLGCGNRDL